MVHGSGLRHRFELDVRGPLLIPQLATFSNHHSTIDPPRLPVLLTVLMRIKLEDGDTSLLPVAGGQTQVPDSGFLRTVRARVDPSAGEPLR